MKPTRSLIALATALQLGACSMIPQFEQPKVDAPSEWRDPQASEETMAVNTAWWDLFDDPVLSRLVNTALSNNRDMAIAATRVLQAQAQAGISQGARLPQISGGLGAQTGRNISGTTSDTFSANASVSFELDLWGKLKSASEADRAKLLVSQYTQQALRISLASQVASAYFQLRALDRQLEIARISLTAQEESLRLTQRKFEGGISSGSDVAQAQAQVENTRASIPELQRQIALQQNLLSLLQGNPPGDIERGKPIEALVQGGQVPAGLPSQLLLQRPDILAAEYQLRAANADIGAARAAFFPSISLTGAAGSQSGVLSNLAQGGTSIWSAGFGLTQPIFMGGKLKNQLAAAEARQQEQVLNYQKTVQTAFREVEDGLVSVRLLRAQVGDKQQRAQSLKTAEKIATLRYKEGMTSFMDVLDAQRNQLQAELDMVTVQSQQLVYLVGLYKALGNGWDPKTVQSAS